MNSKECQVIPVARPDLGAREREYLLDAFDSGWISSRGPYIERAEGLLRSVTGAPHAAVVSNGTTALHLALLAAGVHPGDEVIVPSLTYVATMNAVLYVGAIPVVVDVDPVTWCVDPSLVRAVVTEKSKAILAVDLYGHPADYGQLQDVAREFRLLLIADAAESIGATRDGRSAGSMADVSVFSFFGNKVVTSGEGGAVLTSMPEIHERVLLLRNQGNDPRMRYSHTELGYNYRMTNLAAAILCAQLERIREILAARLGIFSAYRAALGEVSGIEFQGCLPGVIPSPWLVTIRLLGYSAGRRNAVIDRLLQMGVETRPTFRPLNDMPFAPAGVGQSPPIASLVSSEGISLPTFPGLQDQEVYFVAGQLLSAIRDA